LGPQKTPFSGSSIGRFFGDARLKRLHVGELRAWRKRLPEGSAWHVVKALRQILNYAVECGYASENVARKIPNPEPKRPPVEIFTAGEVDAIAVELGSPLPIFAAGTRLRPEEWLAVERRDLNRQAGVLHVSPRLRGRADSRDRQHAQAVPRVVPLRRRRGIDLRDLGESPQFPEIIVFRYSRLRHLKFLIIWARRGRVD
jgi:integrase